MHSKAAILLPSNVSVGDTIKFAYDGMTYTTFVRDIVPVPDASFHMVIGMAHHRLCARTQAVRVDLVLDHQQPQGVNCTARV